MLCLLLRMGLVGTNKQAGSLLDDHRLLTVLFLDINPNDTLFANRLPPTFVSYFSVETAHQHDSFVRGRHTSFLSVGTCKLKKSFNPLKR